jgi:hypothetical protein
MPARKALEVGLCSGDADLVRNVDGKEVAGLQEAIYCLQVDVIGIAEVRLRPVQFVDRSIRGRPRLHGVGTDDGVLSIGFIPHRHYQHSRISGLRAGLELGACLMGKAVSHAYRKPAECKLLQIPAPL